MYTLSTPHLSKLLDKTFVNNMKSANDTTLKNLIPAADRKYNIWLRDPIAIQILNKEMAAQN